MAKTAPVTMALVTMATTMMMTTTTRDGRSAVTEYQQMIEVKRRMTAVLLLTPLIRKSRSTTSKK